MHFLSERKQNIEACTVCLYLNFWPIIMTKIIKTCTKPSQRGHRELHFYAPNNVCSHIENTFKQI